MSKRLQDSDREPLHIHLHHFFLNQPVTLSHQPEIVAACFF